MFNLLIDFLALPFISITLVYVLERNYTHLTSPLITLPTGIDETEILMDSWFFIHILNTNLVVLLYPYHLSRNHFIIMVVGWEIIENIIIPNLHSSLYFFRESSSNIIGDLIAALPAYYLLKPKPKNPYLILST